MFATACFILGLMCGSLAQGFLWAAKAKGPMRKEWFGKLYRVIRDEEEE
jgi:hypothetical protein